MPAKSSTGRVGIRRFPQPTRPRCRLSSRVNAIFVPDGLQAGARIGPTVLDDQGRLSSSWPDRPQLVAPASVRGERDRCSVRGPGRLDVVRGVLDHPALAAAVGVHDEEVARSRLPARPDDLSSIGRPRGLDIVCLPDWRSGCAYCHYACRRRRSRCCRCVRSRTRPGSRRARRLRPCRLAAARATRRACSRRPVSPSRRQHRLPRSRRIRSGPPTRPPRRRPIHRRSRVPRAARSRPKRKLPACGYFYHGRAGADHGYNGARAGVPEWPKGAGCKPAGSAFRGSNPLPCTARPARPVPGER